MRMVFLSGLLALASAAGARERQAPSFFGEFKPKVGSWAEYEVEERKGKKSEKFRLKIAVVGAEGGDFWIEQHFKELSGRRGEAGGMKILVGKGGGKPRKVLVAAEGRVMDVTAMSQGHEISEKRSPKMKQAGSETVTVPAGKFKTRKMTYEDGEESGKAWVKEGVGPWGIIQQESADKSGATRMTLMAQGMGAESEIKGKAAKMEMPEGMPQGMPDIQAMMKKAMQEGAAGED